MSVNKNLFHSHKEDTNMATKTQKQQMTQLNYDLCRSKLTTLQARDKELEAKIQRLSAERSAIQKKASNLNQQLQSLQAALNKFQR